MRDLIQTDLEKRSREDKRYIFSIEMSLYSLSFFLSFNESEGDTPSPSIRSPDQDDSSYETANVSHDMTNRKMAFSIPDIYICGNGTE